MVASQGKLEQLIVAAQEIAASTAQLVVASRVKADRKSENLQKLTQASKGVTSATGCVVATAKDCAQLIDEAGIIFLVIDNICLAYRVLRMKYITISNYSVFSIQFNIILA